MKPVRAIILGYGIRGRAYASYAATHPDEFEIAGLADPVAEFPADAKYPTWKSWEAAIDAGVDADAVVISLPDRLHHASCLKALEKGYHVLLEKPIGCTWDECREIAEAQKRTRRLVLTGYVLRYAPFYKKLREVIASGAIGELTSVHHLAAISYGKAAHAYCRGNWSVEAKGTGMLVNKCTHDFDLIEWWTKGKRCTKISSFGSLMHWRPENRPAGAADRCKDCPEAVREKCPFDAYKVYYDRTDLRYHFADESDEAILKMIETSPYGRYALLRHARRDHRRRAQDRDSPVPRRLDDDHPAAARTPRRRRPRDHDGVRQARQDRLARPLFGCPGGRARIAQDRVPRRGVAKVRTNNHRLRRT